MKLIYKYCPFCSNKLTDKKELYSCPKCKKFIYKNYAYIGVGMVFVKKGKVLLSKRGMEPRKGIYDIIGGFLEDNEYPEQGIIRELKEETGLNVKIKKILGIYRDFYGIYDEPTLNIIYIGEIISGKMKPQDDVSELKWFDLEKTKNLELFKNVKEALEDLRKLQINN
jgi:8-oxo-dGTP diphosphatase